MMSGISHDKLLELRSLLIDRNALRNPALYVRPKNGAAAGICRELERTPPGNQPKFLLVGAKGGGKSTELRALAREPSLRQRFLVAEVDLDASGLTASRLTAFDLLYISTASLLRFIWDQQERTELYRELVTAYGGDEATELGDVKSTLDGIAQFATVTAGAADAAFGTGGAASLIAKGTETVVSALRLTSRHDTVVSETSPAGRRLQQASLKVVHAVRSALKKPICVLIDGLEKMNGEAQTRFRHVFEETRLLADAAWTAVIAAPPSTLTSTNSSLSLGYRAVPVWGFPDEPDELLAVLRRRFEVAGLDAARVVEAGGLEMMVEKSGGMPRHAIAILDAAVVEGQVTRADVLRGVDTLGRELGLGIDEGVLRTLAKVLETGRLPSDDRAARLFGDSRILARPPAPGTFLPSFRVHPLLEPEVRRAFPESAE